MNSDEKKLPSGFTVFRRWTAGKFLFDFIERKTPLTFEDVEALYTFAKGFREGQTARLGRKVVQIASHEFKLSHSGSGDMLVVLCDDGTMWYRTFVGGRWQTWEPIGGP